MNSIRSIVTAIAAASIVQAANAAEFDRRCEEGSYVTGFEGNAGAWLDTKELRAQTTELSESSMIMFTSNLLDKRNKCPQWACRWLGQTNWKMRILGSAALEAVHVASGVAHAAVTVNGKLWDVAAPAAIVLEAGAILTDLRGKPIFPFDLADYEGAKVPFLAAGPAAHGTLLSEIQRNP